MIPALMFVGFAVIGFSLATLEKHKKITSNMVQVGAPFACLVWLGALILVSMWVKS